MKKMLDRHWQRIIYGVKVVLKNPTLLKSILRTVEEVLKIIERHWK
jgi:hypothetical protein